MPFSYNTPALPQAGKRRIPFLFRPAVSAVMGDRKISPGARLLFTAIVDAALGARTGLCKLANATLGDRAGLSESAVGRGLLELEAAGLIQRVFGQSHHIRVGISVAWDLIVPPAEPTEHPSVSQDRGTGSPPARGRVPQNWGPGRTESSEPKSKTAPNFSTSGGKEDQTPADPKPSPAEIAEAMRAMVAGKFGAMMFGEVSPTTPPCSIPVDRIELDSIPAQVNAAPPEPSPESAASGKVSEAPKTPQDAKPSGSPIQPTNIPQDANKAMGSAVSVNPAQSAPSKSDAKSLAAASRFLADPQAGFKRVGFSAKVAAGYKKREERINPAAKQLAELAAWRRSNGPTDVG